MQLLAHLRSPCLSGREASRLLMPRKPLTYRLATTHLGSRPMWSPVLLPDTPRLQSVLLVRGLLSVWSSSPLLVCRRLSCLPYWCLWISFTVRLCIWGSQTFASLLQGTPASIDNAKAHLFVDLLYFHDSGDDPRPLCIQGKYSTTEPLMF